MNRILPAILLILLSCSYVTAQTERGDRDDGTMAGFHSIQAEKAEPKLKIDVFPNPAVENIFVRIDSPEELKLQFELYNIIGATLHVDPEEIERNYYKIGVKELPAGYYLLMVKDQDQHFNQAFKIHKANK